VSEVEVQVACPPAAALARRTGDAPPSASASFYRRTAKRQEAQEHLINATTTYREIAIRFWLEQAKGEMRELLRGSSRSYWEGCHGDDG
jgi:hypothetical protein